jgi:hypothetical protein
VNEEPLFTPISEEEYNAAHATPISTKRRSGSKVVTEPRIQTVWFALDTHMGFCTAPEHEEIQRMLDPEAKEYRQVYPTRQVYEIRPGLEICRDCFLHEVDKR